MKGELSKVLREAGYANAAEFYTGLFMVREEKWKYEEACKECQEARIKAEISQKDEETYYREVTLLGKDKSR